MKKLFVLLIACISSSMLLAQNQHHYQPNTGIGELTMTGYCVLQINGEEQLSDNYELGVFLKGNLEDCRGYALVNTNYYGYFNHYFYLPTIYGLSGEEMTFKLYNITTGEEFTTDDTFTFAPNGRLGYYNDPHFVNFNTAPQPTSYSLDIYPYGNPDEKTGYYLISSPIGNVEASEVENLMSYEYDFYRFNQAEEMEWINMHDGGTLQAGKGYLYANSGDPETGEVVPLNFIGTAYTGTGTFPLEYSEANPSENMRGWNLVGNPFAEDATIDMACYVMNGAGSELEPRDEGATIPAMHGAFVKATAEGQSVTFATNGTSGDGSKVVLNVMQNRGANIDRAIVSLNGNSSLPKFMLNPENTKIYIPQGGEDYAVVSSTDNELPVSFKAKENGTYTLKVAVENTEMYYLHLIDHIAGNDVDLLANPSYTFEASSGDFANRFTLVMSNTEGVDEHFAYFNGIGWTISNNGQATLQVIDMTGRVVNNTAIDGVTQLDINAAPGVYMLRLVNGNDVKVQKVVVR